MDVSLEDKIIKLHLTSAASRELEQRSNPLYVEMELYFSCLIRKKVRFYDAATNAAFHRAADRMEIGFRPVMTQHCSISECDEAPPVTDFPIARRSSFIPHWLSIDYSNGEWQGDFGY